MREEHSYSDTIFKSFDQIAELGEGEEQIVARDNTVAHKTFPINTWMFKLPPRNRFHQKFDIGEKVESDFSIETELVTLTSIASASSQVCAVTALENYNQLRTIRTAYGEDEIYIETGSSLGGSQIFITTENYFRSSIGAPENYYTEEIAYLPNVKAIIYQKISKVKHITTILNERNLETREYIYKVEMLIFESFPNQQFHFSIICYNEPHELDELIKGKDIFFFNRKDYA